MRTVLTAIMVVISIGATACSGSATVEIDPNATVGELAMELGAIAEERNAEMEEYSLNESAAAMRELADVARAYADAIAAAPTGDLTTAEVATLIEGTRLYAEANDVMAEGLEKGDMNRAGEGVEMFIEAQSVVSPWWGSLTEEIATTTTQDRAATTTTTNPATPDAAVVPGQEWLEALADHRFRDAVDLSTGAPERLSYQQQVLYALDPEADDAFGLLDTDVTEGSVTWRYEDDEVTYDSPVVDDDGLVIDFDRDGISILEFVAPEIGPQATKGGITAQVMTVFHRMNSEGTWVTTIVVEIDNTSAEDLGGGWDALLVGSDRRSVSAVGYLASGYPSQAISDDVLLFTGVEDLSEGGELRLTIDYDTKLIVKVPPVPATE